MKKSVLSVLCLCLCLTACASAGKSPAPADETAPEQTVAPVAADGTLSANGLRYEGQCTAPKSNGCAEGEGSFTSVDGWSYTGSFSAGVFCDGTVTDMPYTLSFSGASIPGTYNGAVRELLPEGEGSFTAGDGSSFSGSFTGGKALKGQAASLPADLYFSGGTVTGVYSGGVADGKLSGSGSFAAHGGRELAYEGGFADGEPAGAGTLRDTLFLCRNGENSDRGVYEGSTVNGLAEGQGSFTGRNSENIDYSYTGSWAEGLFDGEGSLIYQSELYYDRVGHFTAGRFTPTGLELLECLGTAGPRFTLSEETRAYIEKFPELLTRETLLKKTDDCDYKGEYSNYLTFPNYMSAPENFTHNFMYVFNDKILYRNTITAFGDDYTVGVYYGANALYQDPVVCYFLASSSSFESANVFNLYGIPLGKVSYTNADGDEVSAIALLVGAITTY